MKMVQVPDIETTDGAARDTGSSTAEVSRARDERVAHSTTAVAATAAVLL